MVTALAQGALLELAQAAPQIDIRALAGSGAVLVLAPHPDDESFGCGAAIAAASRAGHAVIVVAVTDGNASHPNSISYPPERLAAVRRDELQAAVAALTDGRGRVETLGYDDQHAPSSGADIAHATARLADIIARHQPTALWTTWEFDPHIDHRRTAALARQIVARYPGLLFWQFPVWGRFTDAPLSRHHTLHRFDARPFRTEKQAAIAAHASQTTMLIDDDPDGFVMEAATQAHFLDTPELFIAAAPYV